MKLIRTLSMSAVFHGTLIFSAAKGFIFLSDFFYLFISFSGKVMHARSTIIIRIEGGAQKSTSIGEK